MPYEWQEPLVQRLSQAEGEGCDNDRLDGGVRLMEHGDTVEPERCRTGREDVDRNLQINLNNSRLKL